MEIALQEARFAVDKVYKFQDLVSEGKGEEVKKLAHSALTADSFDNPCFKELLEKLFFERKDGWGRIFPHLFGYTYPIQVLALAVAMVSIYILFQLIYSLGFLTDPDCPERMVD